MGSLSHLRVLDLSRVLAGPWCTQNLADLGADVIKVERPTDGDDTRHWGPPFAKDAQGHDTAETAYFIAINRNKRSITVDISRPEGQEIIRNLALESDVVIENYKVDQLKNMVWTTKVLRKSSLSSFIALSLDLAKLDPMRTALAMTSLSRAWVVL